MTSLMHACPHCKHEIRINELPHQGFFDSFRICPECGGSFTADSDTKYRQAIAIFIAIISLLLTIMLYLDSTEWLLPAIVSYAALGLLIYRGNKCIFFVPYNNGKNSSNDT